MIVFLVSLFVTPLVLLVAYDLGLFDNVLARIADDNGSAETRLVALQILFDTPISSILFGDYNKELFQRQITFGTTYGIEIFWVAIVLNWGLIVSLTLFYLLFGISEFFVKYIGYYTIWISIGYYLIVSSGVGLSVKSLLLSQFIVLVLFVVSGGFSKSVLNDDLIGSVKNKINQFS